jgi:hypothetical protein
METPERALGRREWVWKTGVGGAGDWEREGAEVGGPFDQADGRATEGFLADCAVEGLLILGGHQRRSEGASGDSRMWQGREVFLMDSVVKSDLPAGVKAAGKA